jgi:hypothetical protein
MRQSDLEEGKNYALRENAANRSGLLKVRYVGPARRGRVRVRYSDGNLNGLDEWVRTRSLMCRWADRKAFLRDEEREQKIREVSHRTRDFVVEEAISGVIEASGDVGGFRLTWTADPERIRRLWRRAGLETDPLREPYAYADRQGIIHLTYQSALAWAIAFAKAEPEPVLTWLEDWEECLRAEGWEPGNRDAHAYLRRVSPAHALMREWAGKSGQHRLHTEIKRLRGLVMDCIDSLESSGQGDEARRLRRALAGR